MSKDNKLFTIDGIKPEVKKDKKRFTIKVSTLILVIVCLSIGVYAGVTATNWYHSTVNSTVVKQVQQLKA